MITLHDYEIVVIEKNATESNVYIADEHGGTYTNHGLGQRVTGEGLEREIARAHSEGRACVLISKPFTSTTSHIVARAGGMH